MKSKNKKIAGLLLKFLKELEEQEEYEDITPPHQAEVLKEDGAGAGNTAACNSSNCNTAACQKSLP